jgi:hypothetical protein
MGRGVEIPWVGGSKFQKNLNFQKSSKFSKNFIKFLNLYIMNLLFFLKFGFAEIPYINKGLLSIFNLLE